MTRLGPGRDHEFLVTVERGEHQTRPERRLRDRHRDLGDEIVVLAVITLMGPDAQVDVEVPRSSAARAAGAAPGQAKGGAGVDAGGDIDLIRGLAGHATLTPATRTRCGDHLAHTTAPGTGARGHHLTEHALARAPDLAGTPAIGAGDRTRPGSGTRAVALIATLRELEAHLDRGPEDRLVEVEIGDHLHVLTPRWTAGAAATTEGAPCERTAAAEERIEQVAEPGPEQVIGRCAGPAPDACFAITVVTGTLLGIR